MEQIKTPQYYNMVLNEAELKWFFDHIIEKPLPYGTYMTVVVCRAKKLTEEERKQTKISSRGKFLKQEIIKSQGGLQQQEWNFDIYKQALYSYNCDKRSLLTVTGVPYPEKAMVVYSVINPTNEIECIEETFEYYNSERKNFTKAVLKDSKMGVKNYLINMPKVFEFMKSCHATNISRRIWVDFDMDIKKESRNEEIFGKAYDALYKAALELFGKKNFVVIKTGGGFHTLVKKECITFDPNKFAIKVYECANEDKFDIKDVIDEFAASDSSQKKDGKNTDKSFAFIPTPGCRQYESYPIVMNKKDFE